MAKRDDFIKAVLISAQDRETWVRVRDLGSLMAGLFAVIGFCGFLAGAGIVPTAEYVARMAVLSFVGTAFSSVLVGSFDAYRGIVRFREYEERRRARTRR